VNAQDLRSDTPEALTPSARVAILLEINAGAVSLSVDPRTTPLDALREHAGLTGTKKCCDHGQCGACTVHVAGRPVLSWLTLVVMVAGKGLPALKA
jgi:xanthine dehydrogenase YagT iron-sulfur-binding subunit